MAWKRRRLRGVVLAAAGLFLAFLATSRYILPPYLIQFVKQRSTQIVRERFKADVQFGRFDITLVFPELFITGENVAISRKQEDRRPALIFVKKFSVCASLFQFARTPAHIQRVQLDGMTIHVPPRGAANSEPRVIKAAKQRYPVIIDRLECGDCELNILPKQLDKEPLQFSIHHLSMKTVGLGRSAPYEATLTNPKPKGEIQTRGNFGPWQPEQPSLTELSGSYTFHQADLDPFPGIQGTLESNGRFVGILERIVADGETYMPDFALDTTEHPVPLKTEFHAIIDGTTGDTGLDPVKAQFLHSSLVASGGVFGLPGKKGKAVLLDVTVNPARLEDLLRLGVKANPPPMVGALRFHTQLALPPGETKISERLKLDGRFYATSAQPTNPKMKEKLRTLSRRAQGKPKNLSAGSDSFDLSGRFILNGGVARFPVVNFAIPGATLNLSGDYGLHSEQLDFRGKLRLHAKLSQTVTGFKSFFLKAVDPFFKGKDGGAVLPIKITGSREKPSIGLAFHQKSKHSQENPPAEYRARRSP
jgi:hypothetical protein